MNIIKDIYEEITRPDFGIRDFFSLISALIFCGLLYILASICYLIEHIYNFCTGKGWSGMGIF